jgi:hypothetical protein
MKVSEGKRKQLFSFLISEFRNGKQEPTAKN